MLRSPECESHGAGTPWLEALSKNLSEKYSEPADSAQRNSSIDPTRLRHLARRLRALGELLREVVAGADVVDRLEAFARLDPAIVALLGGSALPSILTAIDGGRA